MQGNWARMSRRTALMFQNDWGGVWKHLTSPLLALRAVLLRVRSCASPTGIIGSERLELLAFARFVIAQLAVFQLSCLPHLRLESQQKTGQL
jgi:fumarate reductase subunit D